MDKTTFVLDLKDFVSMEMFSMEEKGMLLEAILSYVSTGELPELEDRALKVTFSRIIATIDSNNEKYERICERNRTNARNRKRGNQSQPVETSGNQSQPIGYDMIGSDMIGDDVFLSKNNSDKKQKTLEERKTAFREECIVKLSPLCNSESDKDTLGEFYDYYTQEAKNGKMLFETFKGWDSEFRFKKYLKNGTRT